MTIQWFPGHMLETKKLLENAVSKTDVVFEVLDSRCPRASANPLLDKLCRDTFRLKILNKSDLADKTKTVTWLDYFENQIKIPAIAICGQDKTQARNALDYSISQIKRNRARKVKVLVVGIPNTGKSTILNTLAGKKIAKTGNVPAVTRHQQRTSLPHNIDIYDTPGILWPVIEPEQRARILAACGAISDTALDYSDIAYHIVEYLFVHYHDQLIDRYPFLSKQLSDPAGILEEIGQSKGCLKKGGIIDTQKASEALIRELRTGKIGRITFEMPTGF